LRNATGLCVTVKDRRRDEARKREMGG
jgi:hypothetical protein